ncbi:hypothetical protein E2C01_081705 [Portunus trituberculatus]|uniref:Uncharacterized protein n=1 Tax=Portunus trituberculatus TaxID=210409 RepID=A0A5B7J1U7_PORTR|nr:hypothetical protein [Portunus trituberculatus]
MPSTILSSLLMLPHLSCPLLTVLSSFSSLPPPHTTSPYTTATFSTTTINSLVPVRFVAEAGGFRVNLRRPSPQHVNLINAAVFGVNRPTALGEKRENYLLHAMTFPHFPLNPGGRKASGRGTKSVY